MLARIHAQNVFTEFTNTNNNHR